MKLKDLRAAQKELHHAEKRLRALIQLYSMGVVPLADVETQKEAIADIKLQILLGA